MNCVNYGKSTDATNANALKAVKYSTITFKFAEEVTNVLKYGPILASFSLIFVLFSFHSQMRRWCAWVAE